ncbi:kinase-like protein [Gigaspora margarita]|uniref:Kinase-like protein n=1 Tax=Gigaspora margarita TaxID=4874 RepID=A0A8H4AXT6_GIGMA|nr:kinase-like protein [Gigaspora margarita]
MTEKEFFDAAVDILTVYIPVINAVKILVGEIYQIYENAECNKELCLVMVDRVKAAEYSIEKIVRSIEKKKEDFRDKSCYYAFERFKNNLTQIKEYCKSISKLKGYRRFIIGTNVKNRYEQLRDDFDRCIADLNLAFYVSSAFDKEESQKVDKSLKEVKESLEQLDDKLDGGFKQADKLDYAFKQISDKIDAVVQHIDFMQVTKQDNANKIDANELSDPVTQTNRGRVFKKLYKSTIEVACKPLVYQNEIDLAILGKLGLSPQILKFYGQSIVNSSNVIIIEWAELGNLRELYEKCDIPWTRKIQIAKDILLGLLFLRTVNIFHHDIRCENVFVLRDLNVKLGNFGNFGKFEFLSYVEYLSGNLSDLARHIVRWMAPELIKQYQQYIGSHRNYENKLVYTFNCEMFSFGMLLWELCYEKLPYAEWNLKQIYDHILSAWCHQPELRITIPALRQRLEELVNKFPIPLDAPLLFKNEELNFDGLKSGESIPEINDCSEIEEDVPDEVAVIPLREVLP